ncbi:unnamed protein product [Ceutorhynchus assimilis]|uniref:Uncharacterized protein n=1 Tax=Ceutorhynchus assimilis TaxID=467358 RepID=A0A9N9QPD2_9CUCU|nr:unnamed protein product [Ceutorhynchus assimilis]
MLTIKLCPYITMISVCLIVVSGEESKHFFLTAAKSVPRIGRSASKNGNSDFENFFLKASKSVPRIGRENNEGINSIDNDGWASPMKYPNWNDIAYLYEYQPELFASDDLHDNYEQHLLGNVPSMYNAENARFKRTIPQRFTFSGRK